MTHTKLILTFLFFTFLSTNLFAQVTQEWVARYNGPGNSWDIAYSLAIDISGNVYVTGTSLRTGTDYDFATIKYNPNGDLLWERLYDGPDSSMDFAYYLAIDNSGNVYITGESYNVPISCVDYATLKYNTNGVQQWVQRYSRPGLGCEYAHSIAVDGQGNVYVTGESDNDYATIKYNTSGGQQWLRRYNGQGNGQDNASSLVLDGSGNVYVTGLSTGIGTGYDYTTIKYNSSGDTLWVKRYNGPGNGVDGASSIAVDRYGNVYVTGNSTGIGTGYDYATIKYNSNGDTLWVKRYNGPGNESDVASSIAVDDLGNVYVTGNSTGNGTGSDIAIIKYNTYGDEMWIQRYNGPGNGVDGASSIAVDSSGSVYVTGSSDGIGTGWDYVTIKYSQPPPPLPAAPLLISPANGDTMIARNPLLGWNRSIYAQSYRVQVSTDSLFTGAVYDSSGIPILAFKIPFNGLNINTTYYWRVNAANITGSGPWSTIFHFTIGLPSLTAFNLSSPPNGTLIKTYTYNDSLIHLKWTRSGDGTTYKWKFGSPTIANPMLTFESNNWGYDSVFTISNSSLDSVLGSIGVLPGEMKVGEWAVWAYNGVDSLKSAQTWSMTLKRRGVISILFYDAFSGGAGKWIITNDGGTCVWQIFSAPYPNPYTLPSTSVSPVFSADADNCNPGTKTMTTATVANNINCSVYENISLEFDNDWFAYTNLDSAIVEASYNGGSTWVPIISWGGTDVRNTHEVKPLPGATNISNLKVRFRSIQPDWDLWWTIDNVTIKGDLLTGVTKNESQIPTEHALSQNYPNPFNPSTKIKFDIPKPSYVKLIVYDVLGREIKILVNEKLNAGRYEINWNGSSYPSGLYFYKIITDEYVSVKKMLMIK